MRSLLLSVLFSLVGCGGSPSAATSKNVFGNDDRQEITSNQYPWRTIGKINIGCTGTLVGRSLVLTAAHCIIDPATKKLRTDITYFYPNYMNGGAPDQGFISHLWWGTTNPDGERRHDWAVLKLDTPLGDTYGWMGVDNTTVADIPNIITVAGYSSDFYNGETAGVHIGCTTRSRDHANGWFTHDCDTARGASGGPVFVERNGNSYIVAINVAEKREGGEISMHLPAYDADHANIAIPTAGAMDVIRQNQ